MKTKKEKFEELRTILKLRNIEKKPALLGEECIIVKELLEDLLDTKIQLIQYPNIMIDENGNVVNGITKSHLSEEEGVIDTTYNKPLDSSAWQISEVEYLSTIKSHPFFYLFGISLSERDGHSLMIRGIAYNFGKKKVTFTISENIYEEFIKLSEKLAINKSKFVENKISEFIKANI